MKNNSQEERTQEAHKAKLSSREWVRCNRTWDYAQLCAILPDRRCQIRMVKELLKRGFFIMNLPPESYMVLDPDGDSDTADGTSATSLFPTGAKLLWDFKKYLRDAQKIPSWEEEVNNVSHFLRHVQPSGTESSLHFLSKSAETRDFLLALVSTDMSAATVLRYIKSVTMFLEFVMERLDLKQNDPHLRTNCQRYMDMLKTLRHTVSNTHNGKTSDLRWLINDTTDLCPKILRVAKPDFLKIHRDLLESMEISNAEKTLYRYYCEALLIYRHMQRPGGIEGMTDTDWLERMALDGRVVIGQRGEKTTSIQVALTQEEEAYFQLYYTHIRAGNIGQGKFCQSFFVSGTGDALHNVTVDMNCLHKIYNLPNVSNQEIRRAAVTAALTLPVHQQKAIKHYLGCKADSFLPQDIVDAATLLDSLVSSSSDDDVSLTDPSAAGTCNSKPTVKRKDFAAFVARFPVTLDGQPPKRKQRVDSGFPKDCYLYDKWRVTQCSHRGEYLLSHFKHRKPTATEVTQLIAKEGWTANYPNPEEIVKLWRPAPTGTIETDEDIIKCVSQQIWTGLAIKTLGAEQGLGVVATRPFFKGEIVCDYHGKVIPAAEGRAMMQGLDEEDRYLFFFRADERDLCIDAQTFPCECHPNTDTVGRRIKHSSERPNLEAFHCVLKVNGLDRNVVLFKAVQDISTDTELKFYSGMVIKSFLGLELDSLDD